MTDVDQVCNELLSTNRPDRGRLGVRGRGGRRRRLQVPFFSRRRSYSWLGPGAYHLDYGDEDHVFLLTVQQIPRRRLGPPQPLEVGSIDGLTVLLVAVIVDTYVHVHLEIAESERRRELLEEYEKDFERWASVRHNEAMPPMQPGERLMRTAISVSDDVGTSYSCGSGQAGGSGTEWVGRRSIPPAPPASAHRLTVRLRLPDQDEVRADFDL